jgi:hypothetical protein
MEYYVVRLILWLRKTDVELAFLLGLASWVVLGLIDAHSPYDSSIATLAW